MTERARKQIILLNREIRAARAAIAEAISSGAKTASLSVGGNSQSYTRFSLDELRRHIASLELQKTNILASGRHRRVFPDFGPNS